jgi:TrmH family RNA methyltransferase
MVHQRIDSLSNPHLKNLKRLHRVQSDQQQFLVEGTHLVQEAIATQWPLQAIYYTSDWLLANSNTSKLLPRGVEQYEVPHRWLQHAATTESPDGVVAIANLPKPTGLAVTSCQTDWSLTLAADGIQDPGNAGALVRIAVAMGANRFFLSPDSVSAVHPKLLRSTAGQWFRSPPQVIEMDALISAARQMSVRVLVAGLDGDAIWDMDLTVPTLFIVGNEGAGVRRETQRLADAICTVPMIAGVESLNVAMAGAILLYEAVRQRR